MRSSAQTQELIFTLKTAFDDFRHKSTKMNVAIIDFADAFGSVKHEFMFETLQHFNIPAKYCCLIEDVYKFSSFSVICGTMLSQIIYIVRGTKTGDPLSALMFILVIDRVCKPMVTVAMIRFDIEDERLLNPIPLQAFADDIAIVTYDDSITQEMFDAGVPVMNRAGLEVKPSKCAVLYARRSGNNWYTGKHDVKPVINVQDQSLTVYDRESCYKYLGKSLSLSGEDTTQVVGFIEEYQKLVKQIAECRLPLALKASAFNNMALAKILHHFYNTRLTVRRI